MSIDFGSYRSRVHDTSMKPEHMMCELSYITDPSTMGYSKEEARRLQDQLVPYIQSHYGRRAFGPVRSFFKSPSQVDPIWASIMAGTKHLKFFNSHASYGQRNRVPYTVSEVDSADRCIGRVVEVCKAHELKLEALELDFDNQDDALIKGRFELLASIFEDGPRHIALGDHSSHIKSDWNSDYAKVQRLLRPLNNGESFVEGFRCSGEGLFSGSIANFGAMRALSRMTTASNMEQAEKMRNSLKELSLIRPFGPRPKPASAHQLRQRVVESITAFPNVERLEIGMVQVMLDNLIQDRTADYVFSLVERAAQNKAPIKRLALTIGCSMISRGAEFVQFMNGLRICLDHLEREGLEFFELGIMSRIAAVDLSEPFYTHRHSASLQAATTAYECLAEVNSTDLGIRVWAQTMNHGASRRHLLDDIVVVQGENCENEKVFTHFDIHPFHYA